MNSETKICQNCKRDFVIRPDDISFYEKMKLPTTPTWCPRCRAVRRFLWRNDKKLYKRKDDAPGANNPIISIYKDGTAFPVYDRDFWLGDGWDPKEYAKEYDPSRPFLEQWKELYDSAPHPSLWSYGVEHSPYTNYCGYSSYIYMCSGIFESEHCAYSYYGNKNTWVYDSYDVNNCELSYEVVHGMKIVQSSFVWDSREVINCHFVYDCANCQDCFMSSNVRNKKYVFRNVQYDREKYNKLLAQEGLTSRSNQHVLEKEFIQMVANAKHRYAFIVNSPNSTGDGITNSENVHNSFVIADSRNVAHSWRVTKGEDVSDATGLGTTQGGYELVVSGFNNSNILCTFHCASNYNLTYSAYISSSHDCFGCVGLRNAEYCILNKQYSKEEYVLLVEKIKKEMNERPYIDEKGRAYYFGEFFPPQWSPFEYDASYATDFYHVDEREVQTCGYTHTENVNNTYIPTLSVVPETIQECTNAICDEVLPCVSYNPNPNCKKAFRIEKDEFVFYQKTKLPLPAHCPSCRSYKRMSLIRGVVLHKDQCLICGKEVETTYPVEQKVYCESCYQKEVM